MAVNDGEMQSYESGSNGLTDLRGEAQFADRIMSQAMSVVRSFIAAEKEGQFPYRQLKDVIQNIISTDYDGRTLIELLQNGHDANDSDRNEGRLEFLLDETEEEHGVLYVANTGNPIDHAGFVSMCEIANSTKAPEEGIGNKGVGFKSVLQLGDSPEIYSRSCRSSDKFDGYCFRFSNLDDFRELAATADSSDEDLPRRLAENVSSLQLPFPIAGEPEAVAKFLADGYSTVVRIVLHSAGARNRVQIQFRELKSSDIPVNLFLSRLSSIALREVRTADQDSSLLQRFSTFLAGVGGDCIEEVTLEDGQRFIVVTGSVPEGVMVTAISQSRAARVLGDAWDSWKGPGSISIALRCGAPVSPGRLYTFLPMGPDAKAPLPAFVNAPFFAKLDRQQLDRKIPLNDMLLNELARMSASVLELSTRGVVTLPSETVMDLACWSRPRLEKLLCELQTAGFDLLDIPLIPTLDASEGPASLAEAVVWDARQYSVFTMEYLIKSGIIGIIDSKIDPDRVKNLNNLARTSLGRGLEPNEADLVIFAESLASHLIEQDVDGETWAEFYDDLSAAVPDGSTFTDKKILINDKNELMPATGSRVGKVIFTAGSQARSEFPRVPGVIRERLDFLSMEVPALTGDNRRRPGRQWLVNHGLVREYSTEPILALVGEVMRSASTDDSVRPEILVFAYSVWAGGRTQISIEGLTQAGLLLPTVSGWRAASEAVFCAGWREDTAAQDRLLAKFLNDTVGVSRDIEEFAQRILVTPPDVLAADIDPADFARFMESAGGRHGLVPRYLPKKKFELKGYQVSNPLTANGMWGVEVSVQVQSMWRKTAASWPRIKTGYVDVTYRADTDVAVLPGQFDFDAFSDDVRLTYAELIIYGLETWSEDAMEFHFVRKTDSARSAWPTFLASFLATASWLPQTTPGNRPEYRFVSCSEGWWLREIDAPDYLPAPPPTLRHHDSGVAASRLKKLGLMSWDDTASAEARLNTLTKIVADNTSSSRSAWDPALRKANELAWRDFLNSGTNNHKTPQSVLVMRQGRLESMNLARASEAIYVQDTKGASAVALLEQAPVALLPIKDHVIARQVRDHLVRSGVTALRDATSAQIEIRANGQPATTVTAQPLRKIGGDWLPLLVVAVVEFCSAEIIHPSAASLGQKYEVLLNARVATATNLSTVIDGISVVDQQLRRSYVLSEDCILVDADELATKWTILQSAARSLAELVASSQIGDRLGLALFELERRCRDIDPTVEDIASIIQVHHDEIHNLGSSISSQSSFSSPLEALLACVDPDTVQRLRSADVLPGDSLKQARWLNDHTDSLPFDVASVMNLAQSVELSEAISQLSISLPTANKRLLAFGLPRLRNSVGQRQQFAAFVQRHASGMLDRIRDRFIPRYTAGESLEAYLQLQRFPSFAPEAEWLDEWWDIPEALMDEAFSNWLEDRTPATEARGVAKLPPVHVLRQSGRLSAGRAISKINIVVDAWRTSHGQPTDRVFFEPGEIVEKFQASGLMDFGPVTADSVVEWLEISEIWPPDVPATASAPAAGLTQDDLKRAKVMRAANESEQQRAQSELIFDRRSFTTDKAGLGELAEAIRSSLMDEISIEPNAPIELALRAGARGSVAASSEGSPRPPQKQRPDPAKLAGIGFAGEVIAGKWISQKYEVTLAECWFSGYRNLDLADGLGSDSLGYDFRINTPDGTTFFEVKATMGEETQFELGETEVRKAGSLGPGEQYVIIFITQVLDPTRYRVYSLPNPQSSAGVGRYEICGHSLRLKFTLGEFS